MKAVAVTPRKPDSVHLAELPPPSLDDVVRLRGGREGHGVLMKVLKVGVDATDREINEGLYGNAPPGFDFLVLGHEFFGRVEAVGPKVTHVVPGDFVTCTVRRPGESIYDQIGTNDMTSEEVYYERGINLLHGYLTERVVDDAEFVVKMPKSLRHLHVLAEPMSCAAKAVQQAFEAQRRLKVWHPQRAFVQGAGQIGLLTTLILRLRGIEVYTLAWSKVRNPPSLKQQIVEGFGAHYVSLQETKIDEFAQKVGKPDLIVDATGNSEAAFRAMRALAHNGVLVWTSITGGNEETTIPSDKINIEWVLGNKLLVGSVNGNRHHFAAGIADLTLGEEMYPGVIKRILTHPVDGLDNYREMMRLLVEDKTALKVFVNVAEE
ncbi:MAG: glucose dehydrogenase [Planctomycetota bacterium]|nr:MAG: glucose dehydrogenase [Planctomycetota bacterium]